MFCRLFAFPDRFLRNFTMITLLWRRGYGKVHANIGTLRGNRRHGGPAFAPFRKPLSICRKFLWAFLRYLTNFPLPCSYNGTYLTNLEKAVPGC